MLSRLGVDLVSPAQGSWRAPSGPSVPIPPPPAVAAARPWAPGVDGLRSASYPALYRRRRASPVDRGRSRWCGSLDLGASA